MNNAATSPDWALLQSFASVVEHGSLSAAARIEGASQPTLSRHISILEEGLGYQVFRRTTGGVELTPEGAALAEHVQKMGEAAAGLSQSPSASPLKGTVRITASQIVATFILPQLLAKMHLKQPDIQFEVVSSNETDNLLRREADIALRMYRPTQSDVIAKKVTELELGVYAAQSYLDRRGAPETLDDILDHDVIGYDRSELIIEGMRQMGANVTRDFFAFRSDDQVVCWQMVLAGFGIGFNQTTVGDSDPRVCRIAKDFPIGHMPVWLTAHSGLKTNPRVRLVYDALAAQIGQLH